MAESTETASARADQAAGKADRRVLQLAAPDDVAGLRAAVRGLLADGVAPVDVEWQVATAEQGHLFVAHGPADAAADVAAQASTPAPRGAPVAGPRPPSSPATPVRLPAFFLPLFERAALHASPARHGLLYRLAWRLLHEPALRYDPLDADRQQAEEMARAVRRDMHKMTAFVRFRPLQVAAAPAAPDGGAAPAAHDGGAATEAPATDTVDHIAWFEPQHHIVAATAPFFARRFAQLRWAILTPERSVRWDGRELHFGPGAQRADAPPADAAESLWLTYYRHIFNPARLKLKMMQKEMPRRYWQNLPEAVLIQPLTTMAHERSDRMVEQGGGDAVRRRPSASSAMRNPHEAASAEAPTTMQALHAGTQRCRACPIGQYATQAVNGAGPIGARLMLVGEQPGDQEDLRGLPFVGPAGKLLDRALARLGWRRDELYVTNAVKHFKFELRGKRRIHKTPAQQEAAACLDWLEGEIALVRPGAIVALGATAARSLLGRTVGINAERGRWLAREDGLQVLITLHPSALLRMAGEDFDAAFEAWITDLRVADDGRPPSAA